MGKGPPGCVAMYDVQYLPAPEAKSEKVPGRGPRQNNKSRRRGLRQIQNAGKATFLFTLAFAWGAIGKSILRTQKFSSAYKQDGRIVGI